MKYLIMLFSLMIVVACQEKPNEKFGGKRLTDESITMEMECENCEMNLQKYISTNHIIKINDEKKHHYCSINCVVDVWNKVKEDAEIVLAIDVDSREFFNAEQAHYVIGSKLRGTMTEVSKFSF